VTQNLPVLARQVLAASDPFQGVFALSEGPTPLVTPKVNTNGQFLLPNGISGKARPLDLRMPRVMTHNITVQHQLAKDFSISAGYVGNQGRHVFVGNGPDFDVNSPALGPGSQASRRPFFPLYGWTNDIRLYCNCANNRYDSLQVTFDKRGAAFSMHTSYTLQKGQGDGQGDAADYSFLYNRSLAYGENFSVPRHQFIWAPTVAIPFGKGRKYGSSLNRGLDFALGGWNLDGVTTYYSGFGFNPHFDAPAGAIRPDVGPNNIPAQGSKSPYDGAKGNRDQWFVGGLGGAFLLPANNQFGAYPVNQLKGPRFINQDISLSKSFALTERARFTLRGEAYNVLNHTNLGMPADNVTAGNAGQITSIAFGSQMRRLQYALRLDF
jgi:hypothetical protein